MFPAASSPHMGSFIAWDATSGKILQSIPEKFPIWSGVLATAGGIVCYGTLDGYLKCVDAYNIKRELWKATMPSGIVGNVFTYMDDGKQYIGVYSGISGWPGNVLTRGAARSDQPTMRSEFSELSQYSNVGGSLTVFALSE